MLFSPLHQLLLRLTRPSWEIKTLGFVPSDQARFLREEAARPRWVLKYIKRWFIFHLLGQGSQLRESIPPTVRNILWINLTAPSLGDALMDVSSRRLLSDRRVSLLTSPKNRPLFEQDEIFSGVFAAVRDALAAHTDEPFDFFIVDSFSPRSLIPKVRLAWSVPFCGLYGFVNGFEVHRTLYSFERMGRLLGRNPGDLFPRLPSIGLGRQDGPPLDRLPPYNTGRRLAVGVGGEWAYRTYQSWPTVIRQLLSLDRSVVVILVGSKNGLTSADAVLREADCSRVVNLVGCTSLDETCRVLRHCDAYLGADGGLWHMASACGLPTVVLFADCQVFDEQGKEVGKHSPDQICKALIADKGVSQITPTEIVQASLETLGLDRKT